MTETEVKYLAGLLDADGYIGFAYINKKVYLEITLTAADSIDTKQFVYNLPDTTGYGNSCRKTKRNGWSQISVWKLSKRKDLEMLVPRLVKHLVIKGKHLQRMFKTWQDFRGRDLTEIEIEQLKTYQKASRADSGSLKHKKHPTWAWVAGYLDGDGHYAFKQSPSMKTPHLYIQATAHENDSCGLELLHKAFGGYINNRGVTCPHIQDWKHSLGSKNKSFALKFLKKMAKHSKLKKHKIEQLLAYHNSKGLAQTK